MEMLAYIGFGIAIIGGLGLLIAAFKESVMWGLGCLLFSPVSLIFLLLHWSEAKNPFFLQLAGVGLMFMAVYLGAEVSP